MKARLCVRLCISAYFLSLLLSALTSSYFFEAELGTKDFIQYWSSFSLILEGKNPYDYESLRAVQVATSDSFSTATRMWNPPWTPFLLSPFLVFDFQTAATSWIYMQIFIFIVTTILLCTLASASDRLTKLLCLSSVLFLPLFSSLFFGQLGALLLLGVLFLFYGWETDDYKWIAVGILLLSVKPHLFLCLFAYVLLSSSLPIRGVLLATIPTLLVALLPLLFSPSLYAEWISSFLVLTSDVRASNANWKTATIGTFIRELFLAEPWSSPVLQWLPTILGALLTLGLLRLKSLRKKDALAFMLALSFSLGTSPYAWLYDFSVLFLPLIWMLTRLSSRTEFSLVFGSQIATLASAVLLFSSQHHYVWYPWLILSILLCTRTVTRER